MGKKLNKKRKVHPSNSLNGGMNSTIPLLEGALSSDGEGAFNQSS